MNASVDGFIADRDGNFAWSEPSDEQFRFHLERTGELGAFLCGRKLYETMLGWETDPALRGDALRAAFADVWSALPKIVFSRSLERVAGNARLARGSLSGELATLEGLGKPIGIGGATLAAAAIESDLVDEFHIFRHPIVVGSGTPLLPPVRRDLALEFVESRTFGQTIFERYRRRR